jgi:phosphatidylglycerophosphate synthase
MSRLPLAIFYPFLAVTPGRALFFYLLAQATDFFDGYVARKRDECSHTGSVLDGWLDKVFAINAAWTLVVFDYLPGWWMACWFARELIQAPMVFWLVGRFHRGQVMPHQSNLVGKITTWGIAISMVAAIIGIPQVGAILVPFIGLTSTISGLSYLIREIRQTRNIPIDWQGREKSDLGEHPGQAA